MTGRDATGAVDGSLDRVQGASAPSLPDGSELPVSGAHAGGSPPARLKIRADYLRVAKGTRVHLPPFTMQAIKRKPEPEAPVSLHEARVGLTVTKKTGDAVERNRIRRRLREALRHAKALSTDPETDYVIVARREALTLPFDALVATLEGAVRKAEGQLARPRSPGRATRLPASR